MARRPSPSVAKASAVSRIARLGKPATHQLPLRTNCRPLLIIAPQSAAGGWGPRPIKLSPEATRITAPTSTVACTSSGPSALGSRWRLAMRQGDAPMERTRKDELEVGGDEDEQPLSEMSQALASSRNRARTQELQLIEVAMRRLDADPEMFGLCAVCEEPIARKRLEAMPHASMCVACQSKVEDPVKRGPRKSLTDYS